MYNNTKKNEQAVSPVIGVIVSALTVINNTKLFLQQDFYDVTDDRDHRDPRGSHRKFRIRNGKHSTNIKERCDHRAQGFIQRNHGHELRRQGC